MNRKSYTALLCFGMLCALLSCRKYEEGPMFSLRTKKQRIANTWRVDNYKLDGTDFTSLVSGFIETFEKDGDYSFHWGSFNGTGTWELRDNKEEISITGVNNVEPRTLVIVRLTEREFWYYYLDDGERHEFHMIEQ